MLTSYKIAKYDLNKNTDLNNKYHLHFSFGFGVILLFDYNESLPPIIVVNNVKDFKLLCSVLSTFPTVQRIYNYKFYLNIRA